MRKKLSKRSEYYLNYHRRYELEHFCKQYPIWKEAYNSITSIPIRHSEYLPNKGVSDPTATAVEASIMFLTKMTLVDDAASRTDTILAPYIIENVTTGHSYEQINAKENIPCSKNSFYRTVRRFYWILDSLHSKIYTSYYRL